jgi:probable HAF family extracellular repeat protein
MNSLPEEQVVSAGLRRVASHARRMTLPFAAAALLALAPTANAQVGYQAFELGTLGGQNTRTQDINNAGQVVGTSTSTVNQSDRAVVWNSTTPTNLGATLGSLAAGSSDATAINNSGQIVGGSEMGGLNGRSSIVWNGTTPTSLGPNTYAYDINDAGQIAGYIPFGRDAYHAAIWNGGTPTDLGTLGGTHSYAYGINSSGQVVGLSTLAGNSGMGHATLWNGTVATDLGALGGSGSWARRINDAGQIVGTSMLEGGARATLWQGTVATNLGTLGGRFSGANDINNLGQTVGYATRLEEGYAKATLWNGTVAVDLNVAFGQGPNWILTTATGINDDGWISADGQNTVTGEIGAFLLIPTLVPEPGSYAMLLLGLGIVGSVVRRRQGGRA